MAEKRYFSLRKGGKEVAVFSGKQPRQAALKAATRGETDIQLREHGTKKVHVFKGSRKKAKAPANKPSWLPSDVWEPVVKKIRVDTLKKL